MKIDDDNLPFKLAVDAVNLTSCNVYLTGRAGTGKTTFLKYIREQTKKRTVVVAPTGVAAMNAGGVTMHTFFQLPFNPYVAGETLLGGNATTLDRHALIRGLRFNSQKQELIKKLDLLIIDEVSMLRADMLDATDDILRHVRQRRNDPFGGVQVLFIGDLFQLPPVVKDDEWDLLKSHYESPFFFSSSVLSQHPPLHIELKRIYRQKEEQFIHLLNQIRNGRMNQEDLQLLNQRYDVHAREKHPEVITLTTHNAIADRINQNELNKLPAPVVQYQAEINGEFSEKVLPADRSLSLKEGAKVMFIRNDSDPAKRWYNGKLAVICSLTDEKVTVKLEESDQELEVGKEKWSNVRFVFDKAANHIQEEELGSFTQYPLRLAWAITIHKSQGLTFDEAVIDAGSSFAAGQVYVALSRCRTLDGIKLLSRVTPESVRTDQRIIGFSEREYETQMLQRIIEEEKPRFMLSTLKHAFDWKSLDSEVNHFAKILKEGKSTEKEMMLAVLSELAERLKLMKEHSEKFKKEADGLLKMSPVPMDFIEERIKKAKQYFAGTIHETIVLPVQRMREMIEGKTRVTELKRALIKLEDIIWSHLQDVQTLSFGSMSFDIPLIMRPEVQVKKKVKVVKGASKIETLQYFKSGLKPDEIAVKRGMARSTIESHLADCILNGEVDLFELMEQRQFDRIQKAIEDTGELQATSIKTWLNDETTYGEIRLALNHLRYKNQKGVV